MSNKLIVNWMFPDLLNLYGDRGNMMALDRLGKKLGLDVTINRVEEISQFIDADLTIFNSGDLDVISSLAENANELLPIVQSSKKVIVIGTTISLFGTTTTRIDGSSFSGMNLIPSQITERPFDLINFDYPAGDDLLLELDTEEENNHLVGNYIKSVNIKLDSEVKPFAKVLFGLDNTGDIQHAGNDGALHNNILWTNLLGPALVRNPWLTLSLISEAIGIEKPSTEEMADFWEYEIKSLDVVENFIAKKKSKVK